MAWPTGFSRAILFFQSPEGSGYSEEYLFGTELELTNFQAAVEVIANARLDLLSERYTLVHIRMNYPHNPRTLLPMNSTFVLPKPGTITTLDFERVEVGALVQFFTDSGRYSERIFRGVQADVVDIDGRLNDSHAWTGKLQDFCDVLTQDPACGLINVRATSSLTAYTFAAYTSYSVGRTSTRDTGRPFGQRQGRIVT
jgi:hypothetical protein